MRNTRKSLPATLVLAVLVACDNGSGQPEYIGQPEEVTFAPALGVDLAAMERTESGLYWLDVVRGDGATAEPGNTVVVHYTGWLPNGEEFDSSIGGEPFPFPLSAGRVIPGWDEGVAGMRAGGQRKLVIPPALAYGAQGYGAIPPNATLVFDVELLEVR